MTIQEAVARYFGRPSDDSEQALIERLRSASAELFILRADNLRLTSALELERESKAVLDRQVTNLRRQLADKSASEAEEQAALWAKDGL